MERTKHLIFIPGKDMDKWVYSVEAKLATGISDTTKTEEMIDHCVLVNATALSENPNEIITAIFEVDDEYLEMYFRIFYK